MCTEILSFLAILSFLRSWGILRYWAILRNTELRVKNAVKCILSSSRKYWDTELPKILTYWAQCCRQNTAGMVSAAGEKYYNTERRRRKNIVILSAVGEKMLENWAPQAKKILRYWAPQTKKKNTEFFLQEVRRPRSWVNTEILSFSEKCGHE